MVGESGTVLISSDIGAVRRSTPAPKHVETLYGHAASAILGGDDTMGVTGGAHAMV